MSVGSDDTIQTISVLVPANPFIHGALHEVRRCLAVLDVGKLMEWWPGTPHSPHRDPRKVRAIQRSLDWKRVGQIAAYLLQNEITDAPEKIKRYFTEIYATTSHEPGREWPPQVPSVARFQRSEYPTFSNVLLHVNGAVIQREESTRRGRSKGSVATLVFDERDKKLDFAVIDGQHRINGAYFALCLLREKDPHIVWEIPAEVFINLDRPGMPPRHQAQIFIDVNYYQKKVDRSLVADLFPTARNREPLDDKERAQDLGRKLMLEVGPLVGMVQIPGIKFGVSGVVTLATLNSAIEDVLDDLSAAGLESLELQAEFLAQCLGAWLEATGRKHDLEESSSLDPENVAYQGRAIVTFLTLVPACIWQLRENDAPLVSTRAGTVLAKWLRGVMSRARLLKEGRFLGKRDFKAKGYLGSGGLARFRDRLWVAATSRHKVPSRLAPEKLAALASSSRRVVRAKLGQQDAS